MCPCLHIAATPDMQFLGSKGAKTGPLPGVTRNLSGFKVSSNPLAYLVDSPGVMLTKVADLEMGLKLALTGTEINSLSGS
jgi:ribosome biogenesis GTPase A